jgi:very-short-patch-repair endonuclease
MQKGELTRMELQYRGAERRKLSRVLRAKQTPGEEAFWELVRDRRFDGLKFRRQHPLGPYIADFFCFDKQLVVELDGAVHEERDQQRRDTERSLALATYGLRVFRCSNDEIAADPMVVLDRLRSFLQTPSAP